MIRLRLGRRRPAPREPRPAAIASPPPPPAAWRSDALALAHGDALPSPLHAELIHEASARAGAVSPGWTLPETGPLRVVGEGLPDWWASGRNLLLAGEDVQPPALAPAMLGGPATDTLLVVGAGARCHQVSLAGPNNLIVVGQHCLLATSTIAVLSGGTILVGEGTTSTFMGQLDARNGGTLLSGRDGMWAAGVRMMTDDMHAIRDLASGRRVNTRGGLIVIHPHVWLGEQVVVMGGSVIGADTVVGTRSVVKNRLPANTVCVGSPPRVVRTGVTWSREDLP